MKNHGKANKISSELVEVPNNNVEPDLAILNKISSSTRTDLAQLASSTSDAETTSKKLYQRLKFFQECGVEFLELDPNYCQLRYPLDLLAIDKIKTKIPSEILRLIVSFEQHNVIDSTNSILMSLPADQQHAKVCITEYQTAGRGRYGRQWVAPFASSLCLSIGWQFQKTVQQLQLISLLPAVALIRVLHKIGLTEAHAKWPNDVICSGEKLAGILIEIPANSSKCQAVVIGTGLNVYNRSELSEQILQPWTSIDQHLKTTPSRNELAAMLIAELFELIQMVEQGGLDLVREEWRRYDGLKNKPVILLNGKQKEKGISRGINDDGSLCVEINGELKQFVSGEISLRADN